MLILVINAGSSSLKYQLFDMDEHKVLAKGLCERIGIAGSKNTHTLADGTKIVTEVNMNTHADAIRILTDRLTDAEHGVIKSMADIDAVGHRVLHGGQKFSGSVIVDDAVIAAIEECIPLGPLHNPANLTGIQACREVMGDVPQVAVFDTAFHQTMPEKAYMYAIPYEYYRKYAIRRYGFHGTSHRYVSAKAAEMLGKPASELKIITCHLGNGSSIAAVSGGKCVDTSMGLTPLEGLPMGTRSGDLDPAILGFIAEHEGLSTTELVNMLNKKSGVLGISELSSDFRDLATAREEGNHQATLALEIFDYKVKKYIGSYAAAMGGVDAIVFTGGIGENNKTARNVALEGLEFMGVELDPEKSQQSLKNVDISAPTSRVKVLVIETDEEFVIASDTLELVTAAKA
ncbi:MAG: acetate kinase [Ruminococcaceae bacterium]|nr:acetate kinase [Oscillospiraceae bacterium]MBQ4048951.1 acetate kinase [Clostridia bacterium]